jgi:hypothetical protein
MHLILEFRFVIFQTYSSFFYLIQIELERLNHANEAINHLELQLDVIESFFFLQFHHRIY